MESTKIAASCYKGKRIALFSSTSHDQAFLTSEALEQIAATTLENLSVLRSDEELTNEVHRLKGF